nr:hypothetical protein [Tanacetum cinerariifolium]
MLKSSNYDSNAREAWQDFKDYTQMESQSFKDLVIQHMESIKQCIVKREHHELEIHNWWKRLNERKLHIQECMVQKNKVLDASSREKDCSRIVSDKGNDQVEKVDSNVIPDSRDMCDNELRTNQNAIECDDEPPNGPTFNARPINARPIFANLMYLKKAQFEKPCLYEIPYDKSDPANRLVPDGKETLTLEN